MRCLLVLLCLLVTMPTLAQEEKKYDMKVIQLVFLVTPDKAPELEAKKAEETQKEHLAYLQGLWEKRTALLVGPLQEAGKLRGLVLLDVDSKEKAQELMSNDPWVKAGQFAVEIRPLFVARNVPQKGPAFLDIEPYWFGILKRPADAPSVTPEEGKKLQEGHMANINKMAESGDLVLAGPFAEAGEWRGVFIFRTADRKKVEELAAQDPAIQKGRLKLELFQWFTAKGTFPKAP